MVSQQKPVLRDLLFELSDNIEPENDDRRNLFHALISEIQETESIDLRYSLCSNARNLGDVQLLVLVKAMQDADLSRLQVLNLCGCFLKGQGTVTMLAELMESGSMSALRCLDLSGHYSLREEESAALVQALRCGKFSSLQYLGLPRCNIDEIAEAIVEGHMRQLKSLIFSGMIPLEKSSFTRSALPSLLQGSNLPQLRKLVLMSLTIYPQGMATIVNALRSRQATLLEYIDLSSNALGDQGCQALARLLQSGDLALLQRLRLYSCSISSSQLEIISQAFDLNQTGNSLRLLDLSWNNFGDEGALALARIIQEGHLSGLRRLNLGHCGIRAGGIVAMLDALGMANMVHLEWLNLLGNRIGEDEEGAISVAKSIAGVLEMLPCLEKVNLIDGRQGNTALLQALKVVVMQENPQSKFTAEHCGIKRKARLPFSRDL